MPEETRVKEGVSTVRPRVSAVVLSHERLRELAIVLDALRALPVDEVLVAGDGSGEAATVVAPHAPWARLVERPGVHLGIAGRNLAAREATSDRLLMLDDDVYPLPGAIEEMAAALRLDPRLAVVGGLVREVDESGRTVAEDQPGTFDWWLRAGARGDPPPQGFPAFFFPEGASMIDRDAFLSVGGFFEPYHLMLSELDLSARLFAAGYEVSYLPTAVFHHLRTGPNRTGHSSNPAGVRLRIRNQIWYFWLRFPLKVAARRIPAYLAFDLITCVIRGHPTAWSAAVRDAWRERDRVRGARDPLPRRVVRRAELNRGRMHLRLLLAVPLARLRDRARTGPPA
jgi:GT2 family glycosyltransferase